MWTVPGRIEAIWFPFTDTPWLKVWSVAPEQARALHRGHQPVQLLVHQQRHHRGEHVLRPGGDRRRLGTPAFEGTAIALVDPGLVFTGIWDIWGQWQNVLLYVKPTTVRIVEAGFAIITSRANIQQVVSDFYTQYTSRLALLPGQGQYPMNGPIEIRVTGLDQPADVLVSGAQSPILSSVRPRPDQPGWDTSRSGWTWAPCP